MLLAHGVDELKQVIRVPSFGDFGVVGKRTDSVELGVLFEVDHVV